MRTIKRWSVALGLTMMIVVCGRAEAASLSQAKGAAGCVSPSLALCVAAPADWFDISRGIAVATQKAFVVSRNGDRVVTLDRNPATGALTASDVEEDCVSAHASPGCQDGHDLLGPTDVELDPQNRFAYVASRQSDSLTTFTHIDGELVQLGASGCVRYRGSEFPDGLCKEGGVSMLMSTDVEVPADGRNVYVAARGAYSSGGGSEIKPEAINVMSRNQLNGAVAKLPGTAGCMSANGQAGCKDADGIIGLFAIATTDDGRHLLALAPDSAAITTYLRHPQTGALTQEENNLGDCASADGSDGDCLQLGQLAGLRDLAISPDSRSVYVSVRPSESQSAIVHLRRDPQTGAMVKPSGSPVCWGNVPGCSQSPAGTVGGDITISADGEALYVTGPRGVRAFDRSSSGVLSPVGLGGCMAEASSPVGGCTTGRSVGGLGLLDLGPTGDRLYVLGDGVANLGLGGPPLGGGLLSVAPN